jgi:hypothetical protein
LSGGAVATVAMSAVMVTGDRLGLMSEQPPTVVTRSALRDAGVERSAAAASLIAPIAHVGFGAFGGLLYALLRRLVPRAPGGVLGVAFGLAVWAVSYWGWIPALGILPPPESDERGRPAVMVAAHVVYGLVLGWLVRAPTVRPDWGNADAGMAAARRDGVLVEMGESRTPRPEPFAGDHYERVRWFVVDRPDGHRHSAGRSSHVSLDRA